jgi:hypothetical protein
MPPTRPLRWAPGRAGRLARAVPAVPRPIRSQPSARQSRLLVDFQTGLVYQDGVHKPAYSADRLAIFVPDPVALAGTSTRIWGMLRLAPKGTTQHAQIQRQPRHGPYRVLATVATSDLRDRSGSEGD